MRKFKITKCFKGGSSDYYAKMKNSNRMRYGFWEYQLEEWGEQTAGGHNYGYTIRAKAVDSIPRNIKNERILEFGLNYLTKSHKRKIVEDSE